MYARSASMPDTHLHSVQHPERRLEPEVSALGQVLGSSRIEWQFVLCTSIIANAKLSHSKSAEQRRESLEVVRIG